MFRWSMPNSGLASKEIEKYEKKGASTEVYEIAEISGPSLWEKAVFITSFLLLQASGPISFRQVFELGMDLTKSPGYPFKKFFRTKAHALGNIDILRNIEQQDVWKDPVWDAFGKFEILPYKKAEERCRCVTAVPVDVACVVAGYYEAQNERLQSLCYTTPYGIGISKCESNWHFAVQKYTGKVWQCDISQFDSSVNEFIMRSVYDVRKNLFTDIDSKYLAFEEKWLDFLISGDIRDHHTGDIYSVHGGNKSGSPNTSSDNTIANILVMCYSLLRIGLDPRKLAFTCYGDDMLLDGSVPEEVWDGYRALGMIIKPGSLCLRDSIADAEFLSCTSRKAITWLPVWKLEKAAFCLMTTDSKKEIRDRNRYLSILLEALWVDDWDLLSEYCSLQGFKHTRSMVEQIFFGHEGGWRNKNGP